MLRKVKSYAPMNFATRVDLPRFPRRDPSQEEDRIDRLAI
jgi:hypothetical protein